ncbi:MAG TPA: hypothetical protein DDW17_07535 [Deltaproteobacteria bacterium]|nr:hypothetical protein [Deltaproteobacteria bacterium]
MDFLFFHPFQEKVINGLMYTYAGIANNTKRDFICITPWRKKKRKGNNKDKNNERIFGFLHDRVYYEIFFQFAIGNIKYCQYFCVNSGSFSHHVEKDNTQNMKGSMVNQSLRFNISVSKKGLKNGTYLACQRALQKIQSNLVYGSKKVYLLMSKKTHKIF